MNYYEKYLKYKNKYIYLKNQLAGADDDENFRSQLDVADFKDQIKNQDTNLEFFFNYNKSKKTVLDNFSNFTNYNLVNSPIKRIGEPSNNGFINLLEFKTRIIKKKFLTIMKSSLTIDADNNYYEYVVGRCLNKIKSYVPNFVYTFNYMNLTENLKNKLKDETTFTDINLLVNNAIIKNKNIYELEHFNIIGEGCKNNNISSILIEYIPNSLSYEKLMEDPMFIQYLDIEIFNIIFQVYATLSGLKNIFTHYDLHTGNIMFIKVPDNKIMKIIYLIDDKEYNLYTHFIPVILDYGRAHINCLELDNLTHSKIFTEMFCANKNCNQYDKACIGIEHGLYIYRDEKDVYSNMNSIYNINVRVKNESCDLRFFHLFMSVLSPTQMKEEYDKIFVSDWLIKEKGKTIISYCIKENLSKFADTNKVNNTTDVISWLSTIQEKIYQNSNISNQKLYGQLTIYPQIEKRKEFTFQKS